MLRFINACLLIGLVALACVIYEMKYESRTFEEDIVALKKGIEGERDSIAVLRAEWSILNRPERLERLAAKFLNLSRAQPNQLVSLESLKDSDFGRRQIEASTVQPSQEASAGAAKPAQKPVHTASIKKKPVLAGAALIPSAVSDR
jgi:hypothetical protein